MAGHRKNTEAELAPSDEPVRAEYERDFYSWSLEQARHLRDGRFGALDRDNLAEEIESLGRRAVQQARQRAARTDGALSEVGSPAVAPLAELGASPSRSSVWKLQMYYPTIRA